MGLLDDYSRQALTYDRTRVASPGVLARIDDALSGAPRRELADIGGGTGNYSQALAHKGWEPLVIDRSEPMLANARAKGLRTLQADAQDLPLDDGSFDAAILISMLHHVDDAAAALGEARRILRPGGRLALFAWTREDIEDLWLMERFPSSRAWMTATHPPLADLLALLPGAMRVGVPLDALGDGSVGALAAAPALVLDEQARASTSYFERLAALDPGGLALGLEQLRDQLEAGGSPARDGSVSLLVWRR
jgi:SAM-dependent methyltransferase